ncbi:hypothetical protein P9112_000503 [Eukaryota sp. TZLM1-RC]
MSTTRERNQEPSFECLNKTIVGVAGALCGSIMKLHHDNPANMQQTPSPFTKFDMRLGSTRPTPPSFATIYKFIYRVFRKAQVEPECMISSLIYLERLRKKRPDIHLSPLNWEKLVFTSIMVASKFADDVSCSSYSFSLCSQKLITLKELNQLEAVFVTELDFKLYISQVLYRDVYYLLKKIWLNLQVNHLGEVIPLPQATVTNLEIPANFGPLLLFKCDRNEIRASASTANSIASPTAFKSVLSAFRDGRRSVFGRRGNSL